MSDDAAPLLPVRSWKRRLRITLIVVAGLVVAFVAFGYFAVPPLAKAKLQSLLHDELGREATIGKIAFDPFTLRATITDFKLADRAPGPSLLEFDELAVDVSSTSLWRWAPVLDALKVTRPRIALARNADGTYNIQDVIERILAAPPGPPPRFSVNNIEIDDGAVRLDDKPHSRIHEVTGVGIGVPFLSSLPYAAQIRVLPRLAAVVNGSAFSLGGSASSPFEDVKEAALDVDLDALPLAKYVEYAPLPLAAKLKDGALTTRLKVAFVTEKGVPTTLKVRGTARIDRFALTRTDGTPLASATSIDATIGSADLLAHTIALERVAIDAPNVDLVRLKDGALEIARLMTPAKPAARAASGSAQATVPAAAPWTLTVADAKIGNGTLALSDDSIAPAFRATLTGLSAAASRLATGKAPPGHVDLAFDSDGARFDGTADVDVAALAARGHFALTKFSLARLFPYYGSALALDVKHGSLALAGDFDLAADATPLQVRLAGGEATLTDVELALPDEREPLWRVPKATLTGIAFDLAAHRVTVDSFDAAGAMLRAVREPDGSINYARLVRTTTTTGTAPAASSADDATWALVVKKALFDRTTVDIEDRGVAPPVKLHLTDVRALGQNFSNARGAKGSLELRARAGKEGRLALSGPMSTNPAAFDWRVDATGLDLMPLKAYVESQTNIIVTGGQLATKGRLVVGADATGTTHATYAGDVTVSEFGSLDRPTGQELVRWKTLTLTGVDSGSAPVRLTIGAVALDDFYARLIVNPDATLNLQQLLAAPAAATVDTVTATAAAAPAPAPAPAAKAGPSRTATGAARTVIKPPPSASTRAAAKLAEVAAPMSGAADLPVSIGRIAVTGGNVHFSDFFVRPNYAANLTDVAGSVSALSATQAGDVALDAKVEHVAPVEIRGKVNPFARELTLDLAAKARDIDLPPLTPYAAKYAGYGIEKGKVSLDVHYKIDNRRLSADNKLVLDQLTFGARVDSPTATKLPVLLAVALLKDRNGVIDIELPISGSLDDPEFSVGGLIIRVIVNLITKIVTAPFAILGALAGGGEQLAYVEFAPGRATVSPAGEAKLRTLAKALGDRPQLKLDVTGRAIPDVDRDGVKRAELDHAVREQQRKAGGQAAAAGDDAAIPAAEYPKLLTAVYDGAKLPDKPKNALGFAKEIPVAEMETLLLASYPVDDEALRVLANQRAQVVKSWLTDQGGIPSERMFLVASKLDASGVKDSGAPTRVDFALK